jgi:hypothetical protein
MALPAMSRQIVYTVQQGVEFLDYQCSSNETNSSPVPLADMLGYAVCCQPENEIFFDWLIRSHLSYHRETLVRPCVS